MSNPISIFFSAWQIESSEARHEKLNLSVATDIRYDDPRTSESIIGIEALNEYLGMFSANAPGWTAKVIASDAVADTTRATVAFSGMGPEGKELVQVGQYFIEQNHPEKLISRMVGFAGAGDQS